MTTSQRFLGAIALVACAGNWSCAELVTGSCGGSGHAVINAAVFDSKTSQSILAGSTLLLSQGAVIDSSMVPATFTGTSWPMGSAHTGNGFALTIRRAGYPETVIGNIPVAKDDCGEPITVTVSVALTANP